MQQSTTGDVKNLYVSLAGLPLSFTLHWPFRPSSSGADLYLLHTDIRLEESRGLHAQVSINLTQTVREALPSLEPQATLAPVINALRKEVDIKQLEFVKSAKLVPLSFSSRYYDFRQKQWSFHHADDAQLAHFVRRKVFWEQKLGSASKKAWLCDPVDLMYLGAPAAHILQIAQALVTQELIRLEGEYAQAQEGLISQGSEIEAEMTQALAELQKKHEYERG